MDQENSYRRSQSFFNDSARHRLPAGDQDRREPARFSLLRQTGAASPGDDHLYGPAVKRPCRAERNGFDP